MNLKNHQFFTFLIILSLLLTGCFGSSSSDSNKDMALNSNTSTVDEDEQSHNSDTELNNVIEANAGVDQQIIGKGLRSFALLNAENSSSSGTINAWLWSQISGPDINLEGANTQQATFNLLQTVTEDTSVIFELYISDDNGASDTDLIEIQLIVPPALRTAAPVTGSIQICAAIDAGDCI